MKTPKATIEWIACDLGAILRQYADGFKPKNGTIISREWFVDPTAAKVIFKLIVEEKTEESK